MKKKTIKVLTILGSVLGSITVLDAVPFVSQEVGGFIIGLSLSLDRLVSLIGDFIDDGKINKSFGND